MPDESESQTKIQQWEYLFSLPEMIDNLEYYTKVGKEGWEFICVLPQTPYSYFSAVFKRPVVPERSHTSDSGEEED